MKVGRPRKMSCSIR